MSILEIILTCTTSLLAAITGGAGILFYKEKKHLQNAEATRVDVDNELRQADWAMEQLKEQNEDNKKQREVISTLQTNFIELQASFQKNSERIASLEDTVNTLRSELVENACYIRNCPKRKRVK